MRYSNVLKILGLLIMVYSITLLPPLLVNIFYEETEHMAFASTFLFMNMLGGAIWFPTRNSARELRKRDGFLIVVLCWSILCIVSALPFMLATNPQLDFVNALFESVSGLTTTGATIITNLDELPRSILYYRNQLQLLGGMGIIILAVAILPMLGVGGMQLFKAEMTGVSKDNKLAPRITHTAKMLWGIYVALMLLCIAAYMLAGMEPFDAICVAFGTVSTGGYVPHDASIGFYNSRVIESISLVFMILGAINFSLHFMALRDKTVRNYFKDQECFIYIIYLFLCWVLVSAVLLWLSRGFALFQLNPFGQQGLDNISDIILDSLFHVVSMATTTGFVSSNGFASWPSFVPFFIFYLAIIGGCAGSTSGGLKMIRMLLLHKQGAHEVKQLIHPQGRFFIKYGEQILNNKVTNGVWGFMAAYLAIFIILTLLLISDGHDFVTAFSGVASGLSNIGPALGNFAIDFSGGDSFTKLVISFTMLLGRLEIFTVLVLFSPYFWNDT